MKKTAAIALFLIIYGAAFGQRSIVLADINKKDTWIINVGDEMGYELRSNPYGMYSGAVENIKDSSFVMENEEIFFSKVRMFKISRKHGRTSLLIGTFLAGAGAAVAPVNSAAGDVLSNEMVTISQVVFIGSGLYFFIKGIVELGVPHKCYLDAGWKVRTVQTSRLKEQ